MPEPVLETLTERGSEFTELLLELPLNSLAGAQLGSGRSGGPVAVASKPDRLLVEGGTVLS